jgi:two-component system cell cycle response regulator
MDAITPNNPIRARILFVDDSKLMRLSGRKILAHDFDIILAENAMEARRLLYADPTIQLMFCDLNMPGDSGYDLLGELRNSDRPRLRDLPAIIMTGSDDQENERQRALELGATDFISKPFRASELMARARAHASHKEAARRLRQLEDQHQTDLPTGLGNRRYCLQRLEQALSFARRHRQSLTLVHLHIDGLEALIEELGQPYGTSALGRIGKVLARSIRREDTVYRTGKESFSFLLPATDAAGAEILRERFIPNLGELGLKPDGGALNVGLRFSIQSPDVETKWACEELLARGLAGPTVAVRTAESMHSAGKTDRPQPDLEQALEMIAKGDFTSVREHLPGLMARLEPLLRFARYADPARRDWPRTGNG